MSKNIGLRCTTYSAHTLSTIVRMLLLVSLFQNPWLILRTHDAVSDVQLPLSFGLQHTLLMRSLHSAEPIHGAPEK